MKMIRIPYNSILFFLAIVLTSHNLASQNENQFKEVYGKVTYLDNPLPDVNINIIGKTQGTVTDSKGNYTLKVKVGDKLKYSYMGFKTIIIVVEDITKVLNINMIINTNILDEAVVKAKAKGKAIKSFEKKQKKFKTSMGTIDPVKAGYSISYVDGEELNLAAGSLVGALLGKVAGLKIINGGLYLRGYGSFNNSRQPIWDVDGMVYKSPPPIELTDIKDVYVIRSLAGTVRYGSEGAGGVIVIRTKLTSFGSVEDRKKIAVQYINKVTYANDAIVINTNKLFINSYASTLQEFNNKQRAFEYYVNTIKKQTTDFDTHLSIARDFSTHYKDKILSVQILKELSETNAKNPELLKAIAFQLQSLKAKHEAIKMYQHVFKLRPNYAQSYRDLANAYRENGQYQRAWRLYMTYLLKGNDVSGEGIGQLLYNEMEWLYFNRKNQALIKERFVPKNKDINDFRNDVRLVFEWNASEAEFELEFVNPQKQVYKFEHSLEKNQELITDEKEKGYSSKEFVIDNLDDGEWLINITYLGNKKPEPTYFKVTQYYNWGKPNQTEKINLYNFKNEREKIQLFRLNKQLLMVVN